ncbi:cyclin-dependent kinase regulatory subunit CKS1, partial [Tremellales sp. Uapishka_1]
MVRYLPPGICPEDIWRGIGIRQSPGWEMYMRHDPEPVCPAHPSPGLPTDKSTSQHVLLFRRPKNYDLVHPPLTANAASRLVNFVKK